MMSDLRKRIILAIVRGAALAGAAGAVGCGSDDGPPAMEPDQAINEPDQRADQEDQTPDMDEWADCGQTIGELSVTLQPQYRGDGAYKLCGLKGDMQSCDKMLSYDKANKYLDEAYNDRVGMCEQTLWANSAGSCGPVEGEPEECCYVVDVFVDSPGCVDGRPFVIEGAARTAQAEARDGWSDVGARRGEDLSEAQREAVAASWAQSGLHEHASVASFGKFMMELMSLGAPRELVAQAAQAIQDEIAHARVCFSVASSYAWRPVGPSALDITGSVVGRPDAAALLEAVIAEGCIGETLSAAQVAAQAASAVDPEIKAALAQIADDEAAHAALAWGFVAWMVEREPALAPVAQRALARGFAPTHAMWASGVSAPQAALLAHGVLPAALRDEVRGAAWREVVCAGAQALMG